MLLLENGAKLDMESLDQDGMTPLLRAAWNSKEDLALLLIDNGANFRAQRCQGNNALRVFCTGGIKSVPLFRRLAEQETDINAPDEATIAPILRLAVGGQCPIVAAALEYGADVHAVNQYGMTSLSHAARLGFKEMAVMLLNAGADINQRSNDGNGNPLLLATQNGQLEILKILIARECDLSVKNPSGQNALAIALANKKEAAITMLSTLEAFTQPDLTIHEAVTNGDLLNVEMLLSKNAALVNERDENNRTPLHTVTLAGGKLTIVELLLRSAGVDVIAQDSYGATPLMYAVSKCYGDAVVQLLAKNPDMSLTSLKKWTALHYAGRWNGTRHIAKLFVEHGASLNQAEAEFGSSPLHLAAGFGRLDVVRFLVESGATLDSQERNKQTPPMRAIRSNHIDVAEYLLEQGASISAKSQPYELSALYLTANRADSAHLAKLICDHGAVLEDRDYEGVTPLVRSALSGKKEVFKFLVGKGANIESLDIYGQTALQRACKTSQENAVKLLLQAKAKVDFKDEKNGMAALHYAAASNNGTAICQVLLDNGAELDARDKWGSTPVFKAVYQDKMKVLRYLVEQAANLEILDSYELTVLHNAAKGERKQAVRCFLQVISQDKANRFLHKSLCS